MRLWSYVSGTAAETEASKLALGMEIKHASFNTGFSGAKLVCAAEQPIEAWSGDDKQRAFPLPAGDCRQALIVVPNSTLSNWEVMLATRLEASPTLSGLSHRKSKMRKTLKSYNYYYLAFPQ